MKINALYITLRSAARYVPEQANAAQQLQAQRLAAAAADAAAAAAAGGRPVRWQVGARKVEEL